MIKKWTRHRGNPEMTCPTFLLKFFERSARETFCKKFPSHVFYLLASSIATATATVMPTMGLLPAPIRPIIST